VQVGDRRGEHGHQLLFLLAQVVGEQRPNFGRDLEQAIVEEIGCRARDRHDFLKARLNQLDLLRRHGTLHG
jgi:hypothetical protein